MTGYVFHHFAVCIIQTKENSEYYQCFPLVGVKHCTAGNSLHDRKWTYIIYSVQNYKFPLVLYGCETWYLTLREERTLRMFENGVLRRLFGPKRGEETWGWRKLHDEDLHNLYSSPNIIRIIKLRKMRWAGNVARMGRRGMHIAYLWKARRKETARTRRMSVDNIKMDLKRDRMGWCELDWSGSC
jgi:hypothetical protein